MDVLTRDEYLSWKKFNFFLKVNIPLTRKNTWELGTNRKERGMSIGSQTVRHDWARTHTCTSNNNKTWKTCYYIKTVQLLHSQLFWRQCYLASLMPFHELISDEAINKNNSYLRTWAADYNLNSSFRHTS